MTTFDEKSEVPDDLQWYSADEKDYSRKSNSKGIFGVLVPLGCLVTGGILARGFYHMYHKNSAKQQAFMRYRVLAQGATLALLSFGVFKYKFG